MPRPARKPAPSADKAEPRRPVELTLYISPQSRYALAAQRNCEALLAHFDPRQIRFEVCDVSRHPERADEDAICYTPMLVKRDPLPRAYVVGDLSNPTALLHVLESCGLDPVTPVRESKDSR